MIKNIISKSTLVCIIIVIIALLAVEPLKGLYRQMVINGEVERLEAAEAAGELGEMNQTGYVGHVFIKSQDSISDAALEKMKEMAYDTAKEEYPRADIDYVDNYFKYTENERFTSSALAVVFRVKDDCYSKSFYYAVEFEDLRIDSEDDIECNEYVMGNLGEGDIELEAGVTVFSTPDKVKEAM